MKLLSNQTQISFRASKSPSNIKTLNFFLTQIDRDYVKGNCSRPLRFHHFGRFQLALQTLDSKLGCAQINSWIDGSFHSQKLNISSSEVLQAVYFRRLNRLVALLDEDVLAILELRFDPTKNAFVHKLLSRVDIPVGFRLCDNLSLNEGGLLYKKWDAKFDQRRVRQTELLQVNLESGAQKIWFVPYCDLKHSHALVVDFWYVICK